MKQILTGILVVLGLLYCNIAQAQAVTAVGSNRLCWTQTNDPTLQGFKLIRGAATGVSLTTTGAVITDIGLGVTPASVNVTLAVPAGSTGYCSQTFTQMGVSNGNYFYNIVAYNAVGNSALNGEINISPLSVAPPAAAGSLQVK